MEWMHWTGLTKAFFLVIFAMLAAMTCWEVRSPSLPRRGLLPMVTTRGDRFFLGLLASAFLNIGWVGFTDASQWFAVALSGIVVAGTLRWG